MSLINKMLQDLEEQRAKKESAPEQAMMSKLNVPQSPAPKPGPSSKLFWRLVLILVILLGVVSFFVIKTYRDRSHQLIPTTLNVKSLAKSDRGIEHEDVVPSTAPAATIQDIKISHQGNESVLHILLDNSTDYQLLESDDHLSFVIMLDDAVLKSPLPAVITDPIVKSMTSEIKYGNLEITVNVWPETKAQGLTFNEGRPADLALTLYNPVAQSESQLEKVAVPLTQDQAMNQRYQEAINLLEKDEVLQATDALKQIVSDKPDFLTARKTLLILLLQQNRLDEMNQYLQEGLKQLPDYIPFIELKARLLMAQGDNVGALKTLKQFVPPIDDYTNYYALMAALEQQLGNASSAVDLYGRLLVVDNTNAVWWLGLAINLERTNSPNTAIEAYRHALALGDLSPSLYAYAANRIRLLGG